MAEKDLHLSRNKAQSWLLKEALNYYFEHPSAYFVWPPVFAYRGSFFLTPDAKPRSTVVVVGMLLLVVNFLIVASVTLILRRESCVLFLLPLGGYLFYILFTHSIERYHEPMTPFIWLAAIWTLHSILNLLYRRDRDEIAAAGHVATPAQTRNKSLA